MQAKDVHVSWEWQARLNSCERFYTFFSQSASWRCGRSHDSAVWLHQFFVIYLCCLLSLWYWSFNLR